MSPPDQTETPQTETPQTEMPQTETPQTETRDAPRPETGIAVVPTTGAEPQGPEDALGPGPKRGDYRGRQPEGSLHMTSERIPEDELERDEDGRIIPGQPVTRMRTQNHEPHNIGDVPGKKGGVTTTHHDTAVTA